ncbi:MAG: fimbrillin family protein, partial [Bacteroides sp.]|nr:fimbrillin family protein [Bacteroides sp.]
MKVKKLKEMATCLLVVLIVTGCSKDEVTINNNDPVAVNFSAGIGEVALPQSSPGSRASDTEWAPNDK